MSQNTVDSVDVKKRKMRLYDVISVVCLLIAAATLAYKLALPAI